MQALSHDERCDVIVFADLTNCELSMGPLSLAAKHGRHTAKCGVHAAKAC